MRDARDRGSGAFAETCPQYLFLSLDDMGNGFEGAKYVCSPPLRTEGPLGRALDGPRQGRPPARRRPTTARSTSTARRTSAAATSARSPTACRASRIGSTCSTTAASSAGRITRERWVEIISTAPAKLFGMYPQQGRGQRRRGRRPRRLRPGAQAHDLGGDPPHGRGLLVLRGPDRPGRAAMSCCRAARSSSATAQFTGRKGHGRFIKRSPADYAAAELTPGAVPGGRRSHWSSRLHERPRSRQGLDIVRSPMVRELAADWPVRRCGSIRRRRGRAGSRHEQARGEDPLAGGRAVAHCDQPHALWDAVGTLEPPDDRPYVAVLQLRTADAPVAGSVSTADTRRRSSSSGGRLATTEPFYVAARPRVLVALDGPARHHRTPTRDQRGQVGRPAPPVRPAPGAGPGIPGHRRA